MDSDDSIIFLVVISVSLVGGMLLGCLMMSPTELPNGCILLEDAIWCVQEVAEWQH